MLPNVLCYIVTYNASRFIEQVLAAIPAECWHNARYRFQALVSDDCSADDTLAVCRRYAAQAPYALSIGKTPHNLGYGGNQKRGYDHAVTHGYNIVLLLHGDDQYDPGYIPQLIEPLLNGQAEVVLGSRLLRKKDARAGGMPLYKFFGNQALTWLQNRLLGTRLSEFHTGLRAYSVTGLRAIDYRHDDDGYVFDTQILIQHIASGHRIAEIPIKTRYGVEICHVNSIKYGWRVVVATLAFRLHKAGFVYCRPYASLFPDYPLKAHFDSSHRFALLQAAGKRHILYIGDSDALAGEFRRQGASVTGIASRPAGDAAGAHYDRYIQLDLDRVGAFPALDTPPDAVLLLDSLERLREPEQLLFHLRDRLQAQVPVIITVPNVAFFVIRFKLLLGVFSYGARGIMDRDHLRFFTFSSLKALLRQQGYAIQQVRGIAAPFPLVIRSPMLANVLLALNRLLIKLNKGLFSFQIAIVATSKNMSHDS